MATFRKRAGHWQAEVSVKGLRRSSTHRTKAEAVAWAADEERRLRAAKGRAPAGATVADLLEEYCRRVTAHKRSRDWETKRIDVLKADPLGAVRLEQLGAADIAAWRDRRLAAVKAGTVRRDWNLLAHACETARRDWQWLETNPCREAKRPPEPPARDRTMTDAEVERLCYALGWDGGKPATVGQRVAVCLRVALETAMRAAELTGLTWDRVSLERRVARLERTKNGYARDVPLSTETVRLLTLLGPAELGPVFALTGSQLDALFRKAKARAGIADLHFHDARATAITRLSKRLDILDLARMVGHRDLRSLQVYYRPAAEQIAERLG